MSTQNHEVFYNNSTPMWLSAASALVSPTRIQDSLTAPTKQTTILATSSNGGIYYGTPSGTENQAYGELSFTTTGWDLKTNGVSQLAGTSGLITAKCPILVDDPRGSSTIEITTTSIGVPSTPASTITFEPASINIGQNVVAQDGTGLIVQNNSAVKQGIHYPTVVNYVSNSFTNTTTTETFSGATLPASPNGYTTSAAGYGGFTISSDNPTFNNGGLTLTFPSGSPKGLTTSGTPPVSGKGIWTSSGTVPSAYNTYIEFPVITAPAGTQIVISWKQAGIYSSGSLWKNDINYASLTSFSDTGSPSWKTIDTSVSAGLTFTSSGDDRLYILIQNAVGLAPPSSLNTIFNISDIAITQQVPTSTVVGSVGMNGSAVQMSNGASGAYVEANSSGGGVAMYSAPASGASATIYSNINLTTTLGGSSITLTSPTTYLTGTLNMNSNQISNTSVVYFTGGANIVGSYTNQINLQASNIYSFGDFRMYGTANIVMSNNNLTGAGSVTTAAIDGVSGGQLQIGANSSAYLFNVARLDGVATTGFAISNCSKINGSPACPNASLFYNANFAGFKLISMTILPGSNVRMGDAFPASSMIDPNFDGSTSVTIPAGAYLKIDQISPTSNLFTQSNTSASPSNYACTSFNVGNTGLRYTLQPILT
jgi:hypothetical protein